MKSGLLLLTYPPLPPSFLLILHQHQQWPPLKNTTTTTTTISSSPSQNPNLSSRLLRHLHICRYRRWDSNAESIRTQNFNFNSNSQYDDDDDEEDDDDNDDSFNTDRLSGVLEEFIDAVWIFKVFRSFGWLLPFIIISLLLATGPKAFLMALAVPIGQSVLSLAFQKVWGLTKNNPKRKTKTKKKPRARARRNVKLEEEEEEDESQVTRKKKMGYKSWAAGNDVPVDKGGQDAPSFGGWDELDKRTKINIGSRRRSAQTVGGRQRTTIEKGKFSRREGKSDTPLLLRLLIAVFPFLGSWTKML